MKNHFGRSGLAIPGSEREIDTASLDPEAAGSRLAADGEPVLAEDLAAMRALLQDAERRTQYRRVCLQYRALADAVDLLDAPAAVDSHRWRERLVEFRDTPEETPDRGG